LFEFAQESMHAEHNEVMEMLRQQQRALDPASERQLQENAQREAEIQTLTRRRDALFARVRHDEAATARLDKVVSSPYHV
jgi:hypothetical protein